MSIRKQTKKIALVVAMAFLVSWCALCAAYLSMPVGAEKAELALKKDEELLERVVYLFSETDTHLYFHRTFVNNTDESEALNKAVTKLFFRGYKIIYNRENTVIFTRWIRWKDFGAGLAYTFDKTRGPDIEYLVELEELSKEGWYYYESN